MAVLGVNVDLACFMAYCKTSCTLALVALPVSTGIPIIEKKMKENKTSIKEIKSFD